MASQTHLDTLFLHSIPIICIHVPHIYTNIDTVYIYIIIINNQGCNVTLLNSLVLDKILLSLGWTPQNISLANPEHSLR